jgi:hypothetical protein
VQICLQSQQKKCYNKVGFSDEVQELFFFLNLPCGFVHLVNRQKGGSLALCSGQVSPYMNTYASIVHQSTHLFDGARSGPVLSLCLTNGRQSAGLHVTEGGLGSPHPRIQFLIRVSAEQDMQNCFILQPCSMLR